MVLLGTEGKRNGELLFEGYRVSVLPDDKEFWKWMVVTVTAVRTLLVPLPCTFKDGKFHALFIFPQLKITLKNNGSKQIYWEMICSSHGERPDGKLMCGVAGRDGESLICLRGDGEMKKLGLGDGLALVWGDWGEGAVLVLRVVPES